MRLVLVGAALLWALVTVTDAAPDGETCDSDSTCEANLHLYFCEAGHNEPFQCLNCTSGKTPNDAGTACISCGSHCVYCHLKASDATQVECTQCEAGYYVDPTTKACVDGGVPHCLVANVTAAGTKKCEKCQPTYYKKSDTECKSCGSGCSECSETACSKCTRTDYVVSGKDSTKCSGCPSHCDVCTTGDATLDTKCTACDEGYYVDADVCVKCSDNKCGTCSNAGADCDTCTAKHYKDSSNACQDCGKWCKECADDVSCTTCDPGFASKKTTDKTCDACPANCNVCTTEEAVDGKCTTCAAGYTRDTSSHRCIACSTSANCATCTSTAGSFACDTCGPGYIKDGNDCHKCPEHCKAVGNCLFNSTLTPNVYCDECATNYGLTDTNQCALCTNCPHCDYNSTLSAMVCDCPNANLPDVESAGAETLRGVCGTVTGSFVVIYGCDKGAYYDTSGTNAACTACPQTGCEYCNTTLECLTCNATAYAAVPDSTGSCHKCDTASNCLTCTKMTGNAEYFRCDTCKDGYYPTNTSCTNCGTNCKTCTSATSCTDCKAGHIASNTPGECKACPSPCATCTLDANGDVQCATCVSAYILSNSVCEPCPDHCKDCELVGSDIKCKDNQCATYYSKGTDNLCHECPLNCSTCTPDATSGVMTCDTCQTGYTKNELVCTPCPAHCKTCSQADGSVTCSACDSEYYLDSSTGTCTKCISNCHECSDGTTCNQCDDHYGHPKDKKKCDTCAILTGVAHCDNCTDTDATHNATCLGCSTGYTIADNSSKCLSTSSFGSDCAIPLDPFAECSTCQSHSTLTNGKCLLNCYTCGGTIGAPTGDSGCHGDSDANSHSKITCEYGCGWGIHTPDGDGAKTYAKGCFPSSKASSDAECTGDKDRVCRCTTDDCNKGGMPSSAATVAMGVMLVAFTSTFSLTIKP